jgi:hypothetical protein
LGLPKVVVDLFEITTFSVGKTQLTCQQHQDAEIRKPHTIEWNLLQVMSL